MKNSGWTNLKYLIDIINKHQSTQNTNPEEKNGQAYYITAITTIIIIEMSFYDTNTATYACWAIGRHFA